jgi:hypothetical protein
MARDTEGQEDWRVGKHEILEKTSTVIYIHSIPYLGEELNGGKKSAPFQFLGKRLSN